MPTVMPNPTSLAACAYISVLSKWPRRIIQKGRFWEYAMLKTHRCIQSPDMHLRWSILWNSWQLKPPTVFTRSSNLDVLQGSKYACEICNTLTIRYQSMKLYWESPVKNFYMFILRKKFVICPSFALCRKTLKILRSKVQGTKVPRSKLYLSCEWQLFQLQLFSLKNMSHEREVGKKVGSQFPITNIQVGKEGRGIPYCRYVCMSVYKCMYVYMVVWSHSSFFLMDKFLFLFLRFFEPRISKTFFRMCEQRNTLFKTIKFLWNLK